MTWQTALVWYGTHLSYIRDHVNCASFSPISSTPCTTNYLPQTGNWSSDFQVSQCTTTLCNHQATLASLKIILKNLCMQLARMHFVLERPKHLLRTWVIAVLSHTLVHTKRLLLHMQGTTMSWSVSTTMGNGLQYRERLCQTAKGRNNSHGTQVWSKTHFCQFPSVFHSTYRYEI